MKSKTQPWNWLVHVKGVFGGSNRSIPDTTNQTFPYADVSSVYKISPEQKDPTIKHHLEEITVDKMHKMTPVTSKKKTFQ